MSGSALQDCSQPENFLGQAKLEKVASLVRSGLRVSVLTAGRDRPYALGLASALISEGLFLDYVGSDHVYGPELGGAPQLNFLNMRDQRAGANLGKKISRVLAYHVGLIRYAATTRSRIFHILWNNKFELFDRTLLMLYYKLLAKKIVFTAHNVNAGKRDANDNWLNRFSLRVQYRLSDHVFVHTQRMRSELVSEFGVPENKVSVIPFGINNTVPNTSLTTIEARRQLGINEGDKALLFFGNIAPYKGLEYLVAAFSELARRDGSYRLIIAGRPKECPEYWAQIQEALALSGLRERTVERIEFIPDEQTEVYFKAADVLILPYTHIFQSGVLFLGYSFGLPAIAADVGSLKEEIVEGQTGFVFKPENSSDLAEKIGRYFDSNLFKNLENRRAEIKAHANERYSWSKVAKMTVSVYLNLLENK